VHREEDIVVAAADWREGGEAGNKEGDEEKVHHGHGPRPHVLPRVSVHIVECEREPCALD